MGLDTVELLMTVEELFDIRISDKEAETIYTVGEFAQSVYEKANLSDSQNHIFETVLSDIIEAFEKIDSTKILRPDTIIIDALPNKHLGKEWSQLQKLSSYSIPNLAKIDLNPSIEKTKTFLGFTLYVEQEPLTKGTIRDLVDWVISIHYKEFLPIEKIASLYEVERVICGVLNEYYGVEINEIRMDSNIVKDLGID
ncbi:acyl carrier protein [Flammeovirga aprica]|uniref:Carrier domain-containing protein n=1 Tax=Flammeovirga aprica JL-4 TaxID=694437 RepID=A0A7X9XCC8_9BACT|nr:hypothetical protein [Flammeovirga aprica]NME71605.1 hypothetical protein [Flammeovirga aprica JL-4]